MPGNPPLMKAVALLQLGWRRIANAIDTTIDFWFPRPTHHFFEAHGNK